MSRCFLLGYIANRHNEYKIVAQTPEFSSHKEFKIFSAKEKLAEYGMPRWLVNILIFVAPHMELFLSLCLCTGMFFAYSIKYLRKSKVNIQGCKIFPKLNTQEKRVLDIYSSAGFEPTNLLAIDIPEQYTKFEKIPTVSVFAGITYKQVWSSFINSLRLCCFMIHKYKKEDMLFRAYSSFPFFLCFYFIDNLDESNELVFYNHYDRWIYLLGNSRLKKTYVQHGKLWIDYIPRISCDSAYYISYSQQTTLEHTLFNNKPKAYFRKVFDFSGMGMLRQNGNKDVLIICLAIYLEKHENVVRKLYGKKVNLYLKPHPMDNLDIYTDFQKEYPEIVILGKFDFPKVDYVISYDSTLADEYEMHDIPVLKYDNPEYDTVFNDWFSA